MLVFYAESEAIQMLYRLFFFSSRRRHTRLQGDWSSDVCSSDLVEDGDARKIARPAPRRVIAAVLDVQDDAAPLGIDHVPLVARVDLAVLLHERHEIGRASCRERV